VGNEDKMVNVKRMSRTEFLRALETELEKPEGSMDPGQLLAQVEGWDSMAALLFMALADSRLGVVVSGEQIAGAKTVDDLMALLGDRLT
jgi:acyl carrier protein